MGLPFSALLLVATLGSHYPPLVVRIAIAVSFGLLLIAFLAQYFFFLWELATWPCPRCAKRFFLSAKTLPAVVDFLKIAPEHFDLEMAKSLDGIKPAVVQTAFVSGGGKPIHDAKQLPVALTPTEIISELRSREYYWNVMIFRTETEGFIRMATNLAGVPGQAWGSLLFFQDQQLFLKAFHWCKTTLPRFRAAPLAR